MAGGAGDFVWMLPWPRRPSFESEYLMALPTPGSKLAIFLDWHAKLAGTLETIGWMSEASHVRHEATGICGMWENGLIDDQFELGPDAHRRRNIGR